MRDLHALKAQFRPHERHVTYWIACLLLSERLSGSVTASGLGESGGHACMLRVICKMANLN